MEGLAIETGDEIDPAWEGNARPGRTALEPHRHFADGLRLAQVQTELGEAKVRPAHAGAIKPELAVLARAELAIGQAGPVGVTLCGELAVGRGREGDRFAEGEVLSRGRDEAVRGETNDEESGAPWPQPKVWAWFLPHRKSGLDPPAVKKSEAMRVGLST